MPGAKTTTLFLVRHAEKADDGTKDPPLSEAGNARAQELARMLSDAGIQSVYTTPYLRNKLTAKPVAENAGLELKEYEPHDGEFLTKLLDTEKGNKVLIVGHSNTVPTLVNELIGQKKFENLQEHEYDYLFMVQLGADTVLTVMHYGDSSQE